MFLNTRNFKGPVAFFTPYFWSRAAVDDPRLAGMLLDTRPSEPNRALQMETQYVPSVQSMDAKGETYARIAPTSFPRGPGGDSVVVHRITSYNKKALWDAVKAWFEGGAPASGAIDPAGASRAHLSRTRGGNLEDLYARCPQGKEGAAGLEFFCDSHGAGSKYLRVPVELPTGCDKRFQGWPAGDAARILSPGDE